MTEKQFSHSNSIRISRLPKILRTTFLLLFATLILTDLRWFFKDNGTNIWKPCRHARVKRTPRNDSGMSTTTSVPPLKPTPTSTTSPTSSWRWTTRWVRISWAVCPKRTVDSGKIWGLWKEVVWGQQGRLWWPGLRTKVSTQNPNGSPPNISPPSWWEVGKIPKGFPFIAITVLTIQIPQINFPFTNSVITCQLLTFLPWIHFRLKPVFTACKQRRNWYFPLEKSAGSQFQRSLCFRLQLKGFL